jgi:hypothetical protein
MYVDDLMLMIISNDPCTAPRGVAALGTRQIAYYIDYSSCITYLLVLWMSRGL